jgi:hypothetical protein
VVYGWRGGAKWGFFAPLYTRSRDPKIGPTSIYQTVSKKLFGKSEWAPFGSPVVGKAREEAPSLPLCATEYTRSRPV